MMHQSDEYRCPFKLMCPWGCCIAAGNHFVCSVYLSRTLRVKIDASNGIVADNSQKRWLKIDARLVIVIYVKQTRFLVIMSRSVAGQSSLSPVHDAASSHSRRSVTTTPAA